MAQRLLRSRLQAVGLSNDVLDVGSLTYNQPIFQNSVSLPLINEIIKIGEIIFNNWWNQKK